MIGFPPAPSDCPITCTLAAAPPIVEEEITPLLFEIFAVS